MLHGFLRGLRDFVYPKTCLGCNNRLESDGVDEIICKGCWNEIKRNKPPFCHICGRTLAKNNIHKNICSPCVRKNLHFDRAFSPCIYEGRMKELIHKFKYNNKDYMGKTLSRLMTEFIREYNLPMDYVDFLVPIPLHDVKLREREFNQAELLTQEIAEEFNKDVLKGVLLRHKQTRTQTDLKNEDRFLNVKESFSVVNGFSLKNKNLLLIDDVLTTGATSSEASKTLKNAGAGIVFVLTLAN